MDSLFTVKNVWGRENPSLQFSRETVRVPSFSHCLSHLIFTMRTRLRSLSVSGSDARRHRGSARTNNCNEASRFLVSEASYHKNNTCKYPDVSVWGSQCADMHGCRVHFLKTTLSHFGISALFFF